MAAIGTAAKASLNALDLAERPGADAGLAGAECQRGTMETEISCYGKCLDEGHHRYSATRKQVGY
jgi:hypothetical protein